MGSWNDDDVAALASAIYGEARNQSPLGKAAVAHTVVTRSNLGGVSVADTVYGSSSKKYGQYSFANPKDKNAKTVAKAPRVDPKGWASAVETAKGVLSGQIENPVPGATNYKVTGTKAGWAKKASNLGKVGAHTFYSLPEPEVRGVVRNAAFSPYRREALVGADAVNVPAGSIGREPGVYDALTDLDGNKKTVSLGEFDFNSPRIEKGFSRVTPQTQKMASDIARTLPEGQRLGITSTHGGHSLTNKTHTVGAAVDVRTRGLGQSQLDSLVDSALYSRPESIGYNDGTGKFAQHMHLDTNGGYGVGLQSHSTLGGLSDYAKAELARYDAEMKSGLGYTPPVPTSIAPVPSAKPYSSLTVAQNPYDIKAPAAIGSPALASRPSPAFNVDGVPINRVQSVSIKPGGNPLSRPMQGPMQPRPQQGPQQPSALASLARAFSPVGTANAGTLGQAAARAPVSIGPSFTDLGAIGKTTRNGFADLGAIGKVPRNGFTDLGAIGKTTRNGLTDLGTISKTTRNGLSDIGTLAKTARISDPISVSAIGSSMASLPSAARAAASVSMPRSLPSTIARNPFDTQIAPSAQPTVSTIGQEVYGPMRPAEIQPTVNPTTIKQTLPSAPATTTRVAKAPTRTVGTAEMVQRAAPRTTATDVYSGNAATGIATDGSQLTRNADGSISRTSTKGITEKVGNAVSGFNGPSIGAAPATDGFWSGKVSGALGGQKYQGGQQVRSLGSMISDQLASVSNTLDDVFRPNKNNGGSGLSSYGDRVRSESKQFDRAVSSGKGGLW